jgi:MFS superfamily sulfate permease-like transporter
MHTGPRTNYDQELAAQGIGNLLCGLMGALPMTGVIVRSAANVQAGGKSNLSAILHGVWMLVFVVFLTAFLRVIPTAALAGILVFTGFKLIDWNGFWHLWNYSRSEAAIFVVTLVVIVVEDLLVGVITGIVLSAVKLLITFSHLEADLIDLSAGKSERQRVSLKLGGAATFLRLPVLAAKLDEVPQGAELHADLEHLDYIDHACLDLLMNWAKQHESSGGRLVIDWGQLHGRFRGDKRTATKVSDSEQEGSPQSSAA